MTLENLFNFNSSHWVNVHDESVSRYLTDELELCELLNRDAATGEGAEVDVDEMMGECFYIHSPMYYDIRILFTCFSPIATAERTGRKPRSHARR